MRDRLRRQVGMNNGGDVRLGLVILTFGAVLLWAGLGGLRLWRTGDPKYGRFKRDTSFGRIVAAIIVIIMGLIEILAALI